jgi:hypothetical protein
VASRQHRRQGVVYGPVRPGGSGSDGGAILGRLLGLIVLVLAVGVLGVGAVALMADGGSPPPTRTPGVTAQLSPTPSLGPLPTAEPTASTSPLPSLSPGASASTSPSPTPFVPLVQVGPGFVTFGTRVDAQRHVVDPRAAFARSERISWSAHLTEPANSVDLRVRVSKLDPAAPGGELPVSDDEVTPIVTAGQIFTRRIRPANALSGPGLYVVRYVRGDQVMSEGYFLLEQ